MLILMDMITIFRFQAPTFYHTYTNGRPLNKWSSCRMSQSSTCSGLYCGNYAGFDLRFSFCEHLWTLHFPVWLHTFKCNVCRGDVNACTLLLHPHRSMSSWCFGSDLNCFRSLYCRFAVHGKRKGSGLQSEQIAAGKKSDMWCRLFPLWLMSLEHIDCYLSQTSTVLYCRWWKNTSMIVSIFCWYSPSDTILKALCDPH